MMIAGQKYATKTSRGMMIMLSFNIEMVPHDSTNDDKHYWKINKKSDGAWLMPPCNNCGGLGHPGKIIDDIHIHNWVSRD